jgi:hypothetical protein
MAVPLRGAVRNVVRAVDIVGLAQESDVARPQPIEGAPDPVNGKNDLDRRRRCGRPRAPELAAQRERGATGINDSSRSVRTHRR